MNKIFSLVSTAALLCLSANAQALHLRAKVPFAFKIDTVVLPAGEYDFAESMRFLTVRQVDGYQCVFQRTQPVSKTNAPVPDTIRFQRYGDKYYLTSFWNPSSGAGEAIPVTRQERALADRTKSSEVAGISLRAQVGQKPKSSALR